MSSTYYKMSSGSRDNSSIDDQISEGEVVTQRGAGGGSRDYDSTNDSLVYASNESLDKDYLRTFASHEGLMEQVVSRTTKQRKTKSPVNLATSLNSTISASNFITQERLMEKLEKSKKTPADSNKMKRNATNTKQQKAGRNKSPSKSILKQPKQQQQQLEVTSDTASQTFVSSNVFKKSPSKNSYTQANIPYATTTTSAADECKVKKTPSNNVSQQHNISIDSNSVNRFFHATETPPNKHFEQLKMVTVDAVEDYDTLCHTLLCQLHTVVDTVNFMNATAYTSPQRIRGFKNIKVLRGLIRDNETTLQEQLVETNTSPGHQSNADETCKEKIDQIRQPYYNQVLLKRVQTLDADREVLRQLNKALLDENEHLKMRSNRSVDSGDDKQMKNTAPVIRLPAEKPTVTEDTNMKSQINGLKNQIEIMNEELMEYKKLSLTTEMFNSSPSRRRQEEPVLSHTFTTNHQQPSHNNNKAGFVSHEQWENLCEHSKLVLEENQLLVDQKALYKKTISDLTNDYQLEVTRLTSQLAKITKEKSKFEHELSEKEVELALLRERYSSMTEQVEKSMEKIEHQTKVERIHKNYMNEINNLKNEIETVEFSLQASNNEKARLAIQVTDLTATNSRLTLELRMAEKNSRKADRRLYQCMAELQNVCNKESTAKGTLTEVLKLAEKTAYEREQMAFMVETQKEKTHVALQQIHKDDATLQDLRRELKNTKERRKNQFGKIKQHIFDQEVEVSGIIGKYQDEMKGLKDVIREKQRFIDQMKDDKQITESRLDDMWRSLHTPYPVIKGYDGRT